MKISIITVVYNRVETIERAVLSVSNQSYKNVEHIVIDGCSNDGTLAKLKCCLDDNAILVSEPDRGIYDAINKGLNLATGDIVGLLHSDDYFAHSNVLEEIVRTFECNDIDGVYGDAVFFKTENPNVIVRRYSSKAFSNQMLSRGLMPAHTTMYLRREIFEKFGKYKIDYKIAADFDFVCRITRQNAIRLYYIKKVLVKMQNGGASTKNIRAKISLNLEVVRACRENGIKTNMLKILSKYPAKLLEMFFN